MSSRKKPLFAKQGAWAAGLSEKPVFIDGLTHSLFYLIVAAKQSADDYQAVVVGKFGPDLFKVKMYGKFQDWGFVESSLADKFNADHFLSRANSRHGYERYMTNRVGVDAILKALQQSRGVVVCPVGSVLTAFDTPRQAREEVAKALHPVRGGVRPTLPFTPPMLLPTPSADSVMPIKATNTKKTKKVAVTVAD